MTVYNRFDPAKRYERHLFNADRVLQAAELNEIQSTLSYRAKGISDVLFKDGDLVEAAGIIVNVATGATLCEAGRVYVAGAVRALAKTTITIDLLGIVYVGVYLTSTVVTNNQDPALLNPALGTRGYLEPGADRECLTLTWGHKTDGQPGDFYPIWVVEDGNVRPKEPPPNLDAVTQALARYDRDSAGGTYVVRGFALVQGPDLPTGQQVYTLADGSARVSGRALELPASRRVVYPAAPDLLQINDEPHVSATAALQHVAFDRTPAMGEPVVRITVRSTHDIVHGGFSGAADPLPDTSVLLVESIHQGAVNYAMPADCKLTAGQIDWSPAGAEPNPGSTYTVTYQHIVTANISNLSSTGFDVQGALPGTLILCSYTQALRRYDRLCMDVDGNITWIRGVSTAWNPIPPTVPANCLSLATIYQSWDNKRSVVQDAVRVVPMSDLANYRKLINRLYEDQAELRLSVDIAGRHSGIKKGLYADPFVSNDMRDAGVAQSAAIAGGALRLPMLISTHQLGLGITERLAIPHTLRTVISQPMRTGQMLVNPYAAFDPLPVDMVLKPAVDRWTDTVTTWVAPLELKFYNGADTIDDVERLTSITTEEQTLQQSSTAIEHLRQIELQFETHFGPGEHVASLTFDGITLTPTALNGGALVAAGNGLMVGKFTIPPDVPAGTKEVVVIGTGGSRASALFTGQGTLVMREAQQVIKYWYERFDPLAQSLTLADPAHVAGIDLWFTAKQNSVLVQLREVEAGFPTPRVLAEKRLQSADINTNGSATRVTWSPVLLEAGRDYGVVLLCDDATTAVAVAELSKWDITNSRYVTAQPYQVGVLFSSSNAATWTVHQDRDLTFNLLAANYTQTEHLVELGSVDLVDATDLMVQAYIHQPSAASSGVFVITLAGGTVLEVAPGQAVSLPARYTGAAQVQVRLRGAGSLGAIMEPGVQLIAASIQAAGDYISPQLTAGGNVSVRVVVEADLPAGSGLQIHAQTQAVGAPWVAVPYLSSSAGTAGVIELTNQLDNLAAERVRLRLSLAGGHSARPAIYNLRAVVM